MTIRRENLGMYVVGAAAVCSVISIAAFEILMGLAVVVMIATGARWRVPAMWLPISAFFVGTLISLFASGHIRHGLPSVKKFYIYLMLFLVVSAFQNVRQLRWVVIGWALAASLSSAWALKQFHSKYEQAEGAHQDFYAAYVASRITGFTSHWMTFSGEMMIVLLMIGAMIFFSKNRKGIAWLTGAGVLICVALIAAETRSVWLATAGGAAYLFWNWKRWAMIAIPVVAGIVMLVNPFELRERVDSAFQPNAALDSNAHRAMCRAIGYQMIKAHPWLGIGPEQVGEQYLNYLPPGTKLPLPVGFYGHLHNIYVHYAAELGIPAALAMLWMLLRPLYDFQRALRRLPRGAVERWALYGAIAAVIGILIGGFYEKNIGDSEVLAMFLAATGCGYVAAMQGEEKNARADDEHAAHAHTSA